jgi:hypothetical protein
MTEMRITRVRAIKKYLLSELPQVLPQDVEADTKDRNNDDLLVVMLDQN